MYEDEDKLVLFIRRISKFYESQTKWFKMSFDDFTEEDGKELEEYVKNNLYKISIKKRRALIKKYKKYFSLVSKDNLEELFDFFTLSKTEMNRKIKSHEYPKNSDILLQIKNIDDDGIKEILQDELFEVFRNCKAFCKLVKVQDDYITYVKNLIITFNRDLNAFIVDLIDKTTVNIKILNEILSERSHEAQKVVEFITEMHARRNLMEHNNQFITKDYIKKSKSSLTEENIDSLLITSPNYIQQAYNNVVSYATLAITFDLEKKQKKKLNIEYINSELKKTDEKYLESVLDKISSLK